MGEKSKKTDEYITLMVIPHDARKTYSFRFSSRVVIALILLWLGTVGGAAYILTRHIDYEVTKRANIQLTEKNAYFVQKLASANDAFQRVAKMEEELRAMLNITHSIIKKPEAVMINT